jgi:hypothetical protein
MSTRSAEQITTRQVADPHLSGINDPVGDTVPPWPLASHLYQEFQPPVTKGLACAGSTGPLGQSAGSLLGEGAGNSRRSRGAIWSWWTPGQAQLSGPELCPARREESAPFAQRRSIVNVPRPPIATMVAMIRMIRAKTSLYILWQVPRLPFLTLRE